MKLIISFTLGLKNLCSHNYLQVALYLSSQFRHNFISQRIVGSALAGWTIYLFSVSCFILFKVFSTVVSLNGCCPQLRRYNRHPPDHTSHLLEQGKFCNCSGGAQIGVPVAKVKLSILEIYPGVKFLAQPKSAIFITIPVISFLSSTFSGFKSLCMIPFTLRAMKALTICLKMDMISENFNDLLLSEQQWRRSPPSQYSITMSSSSESGQQSESYTRIKFGCKSFYITLIYRMASSITKAFILDIFFIAYFRFLLSWTRQTVPKLPSPRCAIFLYFSIFSLLFNLLQTKLFSRFQALNLKNCQPHRNHRDKLVCKFTLELWNGNKFKQFWSHVQFQIPATNKINNRGYQQNMLICFSGRQ